MKKVIGYLLRIFSICFYIFLIVQVFRALFLEEVKNENPAFKVGYYLGAFLILPLFSWLLYKLFMFSGKLITYKKVSNQVDYIGKDTI